VRDARDELDALVGILRALRDLLPAELQQQVTDVIRHVLLLLRAVIECCLTSPSAVVADHLDGRVSQAFAGWLPHDASQARVRRLTRWTA
jgi:hypothetical protein